MRERGRNDVIIVAIHLLLWIPPLGHSLSQRAMVTGEEDVLDLCSLSL